MSWPIFENAQLSISRVWHNFRQKFYMNFESNVAHARARITWIAVINKNEEATE